MHPCLQKSTKKSQKNSSRLQGRCRWLLLINQIKLLGDQCGENITSFRIGLVGEINIIHPLKKFFLVIFGQNFVMKDKIWRQGYQSLSSFPILLQSLSFQTGRFSVTQIAPNGKMRQATHLSGSLSHFCCKLDAWGLQTFAVPKNRADPVRFRTF